MWVYDDPTRMDDVEKEIEQKTGNVGMARMISLYRYLKKNPPKSPEDLQGRVFFDSNHVLPVFDDDTAKRVHYMWIIIHDPTKYHRYLKETVASRKVQRGGGEDNQEFLDKLINKFAGVLVSPITWFVKEIGFDPELDTPPGLAARAAINLAPIFFAMVFFLHTLETTDALGGPFWSIWFDSIDKSVPKILGAAEAFVTPISVILAPLGIGIGTEVLVLVFSTAVALAHVGMNLSRRKFGSAFAAFLGIVPFGPFVTQGIHSLEHTYDRYLEELPRMQNIPLIGGLFFDPLA